MKREKDFEEIAKDHGDNSFVKELWSLIQAKKKYWLLPIIIVLLTLALLVFLSGTAAAPFIYTLF
jgi:hypothetical protein